MEESGWTLRGVRHARGPKHLPQSVRADYSAASGGGRSLYQL